MNVGSGGGAAVLRADAPLFRPAPIPAPAARAPRLPDFDLVQDLGVRIGSPEWFRGLLTCAALCYTAFSFAPGLEPVTGASPAPLADVELEEARALAFSPLAYGADTGRRMAATDAVRPLTDTPERPRIDLTATLGRGDSFARVLQRAGVSAAEANRLEAMVADTVDMTAIQAGTPLELTLGRRPNRTVARPLESLSFRARFDLRLAVERVNGAMTLKRIPIAVDHTPLRIQGFVGSSLYRAARASGAPAKAVEAYLRALATQINVGSIGADDRFDLIIEQRRAETGEVEVGKLLYAGLERADGKNLQLMQWAQGGSAQWFEASGVGRTSGMLQRPVPGSVSSNFGMRRHPILGYSRMHKGMDFRAGYGTPILAATDGVVSAAGWAGGYGRQVRLRHAGGLMTSYSHMSRISARPGQQVRQGQVIGYVGSTGLSTGPHLHYELYRNGAPVNPMSVKFTTRAQLSGSDLANFRAKLRSLLSVPVGAARSANKETAAKPSA
ncbi:MAG TPA: peptidoglycan DD-metalloendopeptidase family protein [Allosphingosinicella sp.]|uniref:M23 family metallopeptidase n=1 Tax=Allosphingosinicella sp. TaxID=2823234 RepID=UPI002EDBB467